MNSIHHYNPQFKTTEKLARYSKQELLQLRERNLQMLSKPAVIETLPDKGTKLKEINGIIEQLLQFNNEDDITVENTSAFDCPLVQKLEDMTVLTPHQGARKRSVDLANQQAFNHYSSHRLLSKPKSKPHNNQPYPSIFHTTTQKPKSLDKVKVRMLTLDESMSLQAKQRSSVKMCDKEFDPNYPSKSLLRSLNLPVDVIQDEDFNQIEFPITEEHEEEEEEEEDMMMID